MTTDYAKLWHWVREREEIRLKRERGDAPPWTIDPILAAYRFCNVRREDDRVTIWIRKWVREGFADDPLLWLMLCAARQINWPDTLDELMDVPGAWPSAIFDPSRMASVLNDRKARAEKIYTGAYMISAPSRKGADKQSYIAEEVIGGLWHRREQFPRDPKSLREMHSWISETNGWGDFMSYQAVVDMRFTPLLSSATDVHTWAAAGPGTLRGLNRVHGRPVNAPLSQFKALVEMREIYEQVERMTGVSMDFSDVPNILCETDKYLRVKLGEGTPRARYVLSRGY